MKAKEWAAKLAEAPDNRDEVLRGFVEEIGTLAKQRGGSVSAVEGAVREQRAKWQAVCRENPSVAPGLFESLLEDYGPDYKKAEQTAKALAARTGQDEPEHAGRRPAPRGRTGGRGRPR
jgi:hypothetical protein